MNLVVMIIIQVALDVWSKMFLDFERPNFIAKDHFMDLFNLKFRYFGLNSNYFIQLNFI